MATKRNTPVKPHQHGTVVGYAYGCRCRPCTDARASEERERIRNDPAYYARAKQRTKAAKTKRRDYISEIKLYLGCKDCGYRDHPDALEFDHLPGTVKLFNIGDLKLHSLKKLHDEMAKCEVICANCHRVRTSSRRNAENLCRR